MVVLDPDPDAVLMKVVTAVQPYAIRRVDLSIWADRAQADRAHLLFCYEVDMVSLYDIRVPEAVEDLLLSSIIVISIIMNCDTSISLRQSKHS